MANDVDHPAHYNAAGARYEVIKIIDSWRLGFSLGNALKYILRAPHKGQHDQDIAKACWYLRHAAEIGERTPSLATSFSVREVFEAHALPQGFYEVLYAIKTGQPAIALQVLTPVTHSHVRAMVREILGVRDVEVVEVVPDFGNPSCHLTVWAHPVADTEEIGRNVQHMIDKRLPLTCSFTYTVKV